MPTSRRSDVATFLSRPQVAELIGVQPDTLNRYTLPPPDAIIGSLKGWRRETIVAWDAARPSRQRVQA